MNISKISPAAFTGKMITNTNYMQALAGRGELLESAKALEKTVGISLPQGVDVYVNFFDERLSPAAEFPIASNTSTNDIRVQVFADKFGMREYKAKEFSDSLTNIEQKLIDLYR